MAKAGLDSDPTDPKAHGHFLPPCCVLAPQNTGALVGVGVSHPENLSKGTAAGSLETFSLLGTLESPGNTLDWIPQEAQWEVEIQEEFSPPRLQLAATCLTPLV